MEAEVKVRQVLWVVLVVVFSAVAGMAADLPDAILGNWVTDAGKSRVQIYRCGEAYCGKIQWLKEPREKDGTEKLDKHNPDTKLRSIPIVGLEILKGIRFEEKDHWDHGKIYDPENGKTYSCKMHLENDQLKMRGYIGISLIGRTTTWIRAK
jgi:uncharacterized protein (DUF2147 family)